MNIMICAKIYLIGQTESSVECFVRFNIFEYAQLLYKCFNSVVYNTTKQNLVVTLTTLLIKAKSSTATELRKEGRLELIQCIHNYIHLIRACHIAWLSQDTCCDMLIEKNMYLFLCNKSESIQVARQLRRSLLKVYLFPTKHH